ncbi:MAG: DNA glycosylase AlkZ-like family protein [Methanobacterium sp.]
MLFSTGLSRCTLAIGLRTNNVLEADIEQAIRDKTIVRTWLLRGTLHLASAEDVR